MDPLARMFERFREQGDLGALGEVFDRTAPRLLALALHLCGEPADAEDYLQQTFLLAMQQSAAFARERPLEPWLAGLLANLVRNGRRRGQVRRAQPLPELPSGDSGPLAAAERAELVATLRTRVEALPQPQRQVLRLQLLHGMTPAEIAEVLEVPPGTVRMRIHRGLQALRKLLPAGLAAWLFGVLPQRGLAAVRQAVLRAGKTEVLAAGMTAAVATGFAGVLAMKQVLMVVVVVFVLGALWWANAGAAPVVPLAGAGGPAPAPVAASVGNDVEQVGESRQATDRIAAPAAAGALRVRVVARVQQKDGEATSLPFAGVMLQLWSGTSPLLPFDGPVRTARTDASGEAAWTGLAPGPWQVALPADGEAEARAIAVEAGGEAVLEWQRQASSVVRGIVVDCDGRPVEGAEVWVYRGAFSLRRYSLPEPGDLLARRAARSDANGRFALARSARESRVGACCAGYGESFGSDVLADGDGEEVRLVLGREHASVSGTVRDEAGNALDGALVMFRPAGQDSRRAGDGSLLLARVDRLAYTDAQGRFTFEGVAPGRARISASARPRMPAGRELDVAAFAHAVVDLQCAEGVTVVGTVRYADGSPVRTAVETTARLPWDGTWTHCDTREDGSYLLEYQPRRPFFVVIGSHQKTIASREFATPEEGVIRCDFVLQELTGVRGRVVGPDGEGLVGWSVVAKNDDHRSWQRTDATGAFQIGAPLAAAFSLVAYPPEGSERAPAVERSGLRVDGPPVELRVPFAALPTAAARGRLIGPDGVPLDGIAITVSLVGRDLIRRDTTAAGRFAVAPMPAGKYRLALDWSGETGPEVAQFELQAGEQCDLGDLIVQPPAVLQVQVTCGDGSAWCGALPALVLTNSAGGRAACETTRQGGGLRVRVAAGHYRVELVGADLLTSPQQVELTAGEARTLRFAVGIGRSRKLVCNGDGHDKPERGQLLHLTLRHDGEVLAQQDVPVSAWDLRGFYSWSFERVLTFGSYEVEAHTEAGQHYRAAFEVRDSLDDPTRIDVPLVPQ